MPEANTRRLAARVRVLVSLLPGGGCGHRYAQPQPCFSGRSVASRQFQENLILGLFILDLEVTNPAPPLSSIQQCDPWTKSICLFLGQKPIAVSSISRIYDACPSAVARNDLALRAVRQPFVGPLRPQTDLLRRKHALWVAIAIQLETAVSQIMDWWQNKTRCLRAGWSSNYHGTQTSPPYAAVTGPGLCLLFLSTPIIRAETWLRED